MTPTVPPIPEGFEEITFAKNQPPYIPLPAAVDKNGTVITEWELTATELGRLMCGGRIRLCLYGTGVQNGVPLSPIRIEALEPTEIES